MSDLGARAATVRIPPTPERFERLCRDFTSLRDSALADGQPWPESLEAWSDVLAREWGSLAPEDV